MTTLTNEEQVQEFLDNENKPAPLRHDTMEALQPARGDDFASTLERFEADVTAEFKVDMAPLNAYRDDQRTSYMISNLVARFASAANSAADKQADNVKAMLKADEIKAQEARENDHPSMVQIDQRNARQEFIRGRMFQAKFCRGVCTALADIYADMTGETWKPFGQRGVARSSQLEAEHHQNAAAQQLSNIKL
jgi:hypothetical protein